MGTVPPSTSEGKGAPHMHWLQARDEGAANARSRATSTAASARERVSRESNCLNESSRSVQDNLLEPGRGSNRGHLKRCASAWFGVISSATATPPLPPGPNADFWPR